DLPFLFRDRKHMYGVMDGPVGAELGDKMRGKGFRLLSYYEAGIRHIMTNKKSLTKLDDLKGLKIRTMENPVHLDAFRAMGASPRPTPGARTWRWPRSRPRASRSRRLTRSRSARRRRACTRSSVAPRTRRA